MYVPVHGLVPECVRVCVCVCVRACVCVDSLELEGLLVVCSKQRIAEAKVLNLKKNELEKQGIPSDGDTAKRSSKGTRLGKPEDSFPIASAECSRALFGIFVHQAFMSSHLLVVEGSKSLEASNDASSVAAMTAAVDGANSEPTATPDSDASDRGAGLAAVLRQRREQAAKSAREREQKQQQERVQ